jgi:hypothetical protein
MPLARSALATARWQNLSPFEVQSAVRAGDTCCVLARSGVGASVACARCVNYGVHVHSRVQTDRPRNRGRPQPSPTPRAATACVSLARACAGGHQPPPAADTHDNPPPSLVAAVARGRTRLASYTGWCASACLEPGAQARTMSPRRGSTQVSSRVCTGHLNSCACTQVAPVHTRPHDSYRHHVRINTLQCDLRRPLPQPQLAQQATRPPHC